MALISGREDFFRVYEKETVYVLTPFTKAVKGVHTLSQLHTSRAARWSPSTTGWSCWKQS